jgi:hypothetical protein
MGKAFFILVWTFLQACKSEIRLEGFKAQKWKEDLNGCQGSRQKLLFILMANQKELIGRNELEIKALLGKPESTDIRTRGQKFFEYGVKGGNLCQPGSLESPEILRIRFDALDRVSEVAVY